MNKKIKKINSIINIIGIKKLSILDNNTIYKVLI